MRTVSAESHFSWILVLEGSKKLWRVSAEARYDGQSWQEEKISGLVYLYPVCKNRWKKQEAKPYADTICLYPND